MNTDTQKIQDMLGAGVHFGHNRARRHPSAKPYIFANKNGTDIFDLTKIEEMIMKAETFLAECGKEKKTILFVGVKPEAKAITKEVAIALSMPYVTNRWIGGTLTNFDHIRKRVDRLLELRKQGTRGDLMKYTKRERAKITQEVKDLERYFTGIVNMSRLPGALFVVDPKKEKTSLAEAKALGIPVIVLANTDCDVSKIDYPIVGNDKTTASISLVVQSLLNSYKEGVPA